MRFGTLNVRSLYRTGSLTTVATELLRYTLDLTGTQEDSWDIGEHGKSRGFYFFYGCEKK